MCVGGCVVNGTGSVFDSHCSANFRKPNEKKELCSSCKRKGKPENGAKKYYECAIIWLTEPQDNSLQTTTTTAVQVTNTHTEAANELQTRPSHNASCQRIWKTILQLLLWPPPFVYVCVRIEVCVSVCVSVFDFSHEYMSTSLCVHIVYMPNGTF